MGKGLWLGVLLAVAAIVAPVQAETAPRAAEPSAQLIPPVTLGVVSWIPVEAFRNRMAPFLEYLERRLPYSVRLVIVEDAPSFYAAVAARAFDFAYVDGCFATAEMARGHHRPIIELEFSEIHALVIVNAESNLKEVSDLVGRTILVPMDARAVSARLGLLAIAEGLGKQSDPGLELRVASDNGRVIFDIIEGRAEAGIIHDVALAALAEPLRDSLRVIATSERGPNPYLIARADLPFAIADQVREAWLGFEKDPAAADYLSKSPIQRFRAVEAARLTEVTAFCERIESFTAPLMNPPPARR